MRRLRWPLLVLTVCLPVAVLALGVRVPFLDRPTGLPRPLPVPDGDQEMAWLHTTTNWTTWERFVSGVTRAQTLVPGLRVDDSEAFQDQTYNVPEVVLSMDGKPGKLHIRWYKLTSDVTSDQWVRALSTRRPTPLAVIGGGSSDRAADLARAMNRQEAWEGDRPPLLITTATADKLVDAADAPAPPEGEFHPSLLDVYPKRSFRFCFSNRQMAGAVIDFVWDRPELRPQVFAATAPLAVCSGLAAALPPQGGEKPQVFTVSWQDDPYSKDLDWQFGEVFKDRLCPKDDPAAMPLRFSRWPLPFSVGGFIRPNPYEARVAESILEQFHALPPQRSVLVLPTVTVPARRLLRTLADAAPNLGQRMVAVTGDGIPVNAIYRDGEFAWPVQTMPVPLVLFAHHNPVAWDVPDLGPTCPAGTGLAPPTSTEDVLHFAEMTRVVAEACYGVGGSGGDVPADAGLVARADEFARRLRQRVPAFFEDSGDRVGGTGEYVVVVRPRDPAGESGPEPLARLDVWRRDGPSRWKHVRTVDVDQWHTRTVRPDPAPDSPPRAGGGPTPGRHG